MDDFLFDTTLDESKEEQVPIKPTSKRTSSVHDTFATEDELLSVAELGYSVYSLHSNPSPLQLMKLMGTVDNSFFAEKKQMSVEAYYISNLLDILF